MPKQQYTTSSSDLNLTEEEDSAVEYRTASKEDLHPNDKLKFAKMTLLGLGILAVSVIVMHFYLIIKHGSDKLETIVTAVFTAVVTLSTSIITFYFKDTRR
ncbi:hypothetical protein [Aureibacter tunicatorum]|uniref:Membrane protein YesL n=1 Tax=Aureibacter tunicatorum TaxID=866807 RepID=A0AAE3XKD1_9BACT|nr:hypothetical protein [Aureibacter tunicatorum]MDR6237525.1 putative membrane protein YesL [Aureibacter tunicatorum]BDD02559.1 hypothetical protein AUTU_00420 [Aureibacter tunicatorum]